LLANLANIETICRWCVVSDSIRLHFWSYAAISAQEQWKRDGSHHQSMAAIIWELEKWHTWF